MKGFSIAINDWGVHAILYAGFAGSDSVAWLSSLRDAADRSAKQGRPPGLFVDLRGAGALSVSHLDGLSAQLTRAGIGRSAVLLSDATLARRLRTAVEKTGAAGVRIIVTDGRDRFLIAAAYKWVLNGTEPTAGRTAPQQAGEVVPFPAASPAPQAAAASGPMRAAS